MSVHFAKHKKHAQAGMPMPPDVILFLNKGAAFYSLAMTN